MREARESDTAPAFAELVDSMRRGGWQRRPVDVVRMPDGEMTTLDNARLAAARAAGIGMPSIVHDSAGSDDIVCVDLSDPTGRIVEIHAFASSGWEFRGSWPNLTTRLEGRGRRAWTS